MKCGESLLIQLWIRSVYCHREENYLTQHQMSRSQFLGLELKNSFDALDAFTCVDALV